MVTMQKNDRDRDAKFEQIMAHINDGDRAVENERFVLTLSWDSNEINVREPLSDNRLVAYSSTKADFQSSLEEFVWDYFTE